MLILYGGPVAGSREGGNYLRSVSDIAYWLTLSEAQEWLRRQSQKSKITLAPKACASTRHSDIRKKCDRTDVPVLS